MRLACPLCAPTHTHHTIPTPSPFLIDTQLATTLIMPSSSVATAPPSSASPLPCASDPTMTVIDPTTRRPTPSTTTTTSSVIIPTRGQAELDEQNAGEGDNGGEEGKGDRRSEPRTLEEAGPLKVLYRGHDLLVIDKPPDVRMQGAFLVTVEHLVRHYCPLDAPPSLALKYIHQLDYATSGVLCLGLSRKAAAATAELFMNRQTEKEYLALVEGHLDPSLPPFLEAESDDPPPTSSSSSLPPSSYLPGIHPEAGRRGRGGRKGRRGGSVGVIYKPASTFYRDKQLALERRRKKEEEEGGKEGGKEGWTEEEQRLLEGMKWKEAKHTLSDIIAECEALAAADKKAKEAEQEPSPPSSLPPSKDLRAFRRKGDGEGTFVVDVAITEFKDDFRVRLGLPPPSSSSLPSLPPSLPSSSDPPARRARTQVQVLGYGLCEGKEVTKLLLRPISGRRHQLRVHCLYVGHPIVGDSTYGGDTTSPRMMLHALALTLPFPAGKGPGETLTIRTEDPFEGKYFTPL